jgi:hypothetical protein
MRGIGPQPARPAAGTRLRFENSFGKPVFVYELDRWGGWRWKAQLDPGAAYTGVGQPGDLWTVSDRAGRQLRSVRVVANMPPVIIRSAGVRALNFNAEAQPFVVRENVTLTSG